jgi:tRNA(Ile)-lysidine synthase
VAKPSAKFHEIVIVAGRRSGQVGGRMASELKIPWLETAAPQRRWLVGVSGGADSVALLHLLVARGFRNLVVCHLDHRLRGRASTADARFVAKLAASLGLPCEIQRVWVGRLAQERRESMETAARRARHEWFAACAGKFRCRRVLLAHHADDQAETVLWNLLRGSHGLKGIREEQRIVVPGGRELELFRPLLGLRRQELRDWLAERGLRWREDASNAQPVAARNRLRHEGLPLLSEIAGREAAPMVARAALATAEQEEITAWALDQARVLDPQGRLHLPAVRLLPAALQRAALARLLGEHAVPGVDRALLDRALALLDPGAPATVNLPGGGWLRRREARVFVTEG